MEWGNIADWTNVLVTFFGFIYAIHTYKDSKNPALGITLRNSKDNLDNEYEGYEIVVANNSDNHLILENCFEKLPQSYKHYLDDDSTKYYCDGFTNRKIVRQHEIATLWVMPTILVNYLRKYKNEVIDFSFIDKVSGHKYHVELYLKDRYVDYRIIK